MKTLLNYINESKIINEGFIIDDCNDVLDDIAILLNFDLRDPDQLQECTYYEGDFDEFSENLTQAVIDFCEDSKIKIVADDYYNDIDYLEESGFPASVYTNVGLVKKCSSKDFKYVIGEEENNNNPYAFSINKSSDNKVMEIYSEMITFYLLKA